MKRFHLLITSALCLAVLTAWQLPAPPEPPPGVSARAWAATAVQGAVADVIVTLPGYPDLSPARALRSKREKTRFVVQALQAHAERAQAQLRADLAARGLDFFPLWITNQIVVRRIDRPTLRWLGTRSDVVRVDLDEQTRGLDNQAEHQRPKSRAALHAPHSPTAIEWGVQRVNAPPVWAMGYTGQGIVIANLDTGVRWDHQALKPHYRGWDGVAADHNYNWFDAAPEGSDPPSSTPQDVNGHGTHTTGTAVGDDGMGNQIGVAPGAKWIACRNMAGPSGIGSVARYVACFQFALAPTDVNGNSPDPDRSADITSNSWACDPGYGEIGCDVPTALVTATQALRNAGIMVIASAGNSGPSCGTVRLAPATLDQAFTVGATNGSDTIAGFSSRGPSWLTGRIKPDVVAPGVGVRSARSLAPNSYGFLSGTSMAAPHVAGVVALLWSAAPELRGEVETTEMLLRQTARPLTDSQTCAGVPGSAWPNNTYGYGLVDALAAVNVALGAPVVTAPAHAPVNQPFTVVISTTNVTPLTRTGAVISISLPTTITLISSEPPGIVSGNVVSWTFPSLAPSSTLTVSLTISAALPGLVTHQAYLRFDGLPSPIPGKTAATLLSYRLIFPLIVRSPD